MVEAHFMVFIMLMCLGMNQLTNIETERTKSDTFHPKFRSISFLVSRSASVEKAISVIPKNKAD